MKSQSLRQTVKALSGTGALIVVSALLAAAQTASPKPCPAGGRAIRVGNQYCRAFLSAQAKPTEEASQPLLLAHLRAVDLDLLAPPTVPRAEKGRAAEPALLAEFVALRWSPDKAVANTVPAPALSFQSTVTPQFLLNLHQESRQVFAALPLSTLPLTLFQYTRTGGPFEQVLPLTW
jgi:hypothetical protein